MISTLAGVVLALLQTNVAAAPSSPTGREQTRTIEDPDWLRLPEPRVASEYYPSRAVFARVNGHVVVDCVAKADGRLTHCSVTGESPLGWRFGAAAILLAALYQMKPQRDDGRTVAGAHVRFPIDFAFPPKQPQASLPEPAFVPVMPGAQVQVTSGGSAATVREGVTVQVECLAMGDGSLKNCRATSSSPANTVAEQIAVQIASAQHGDPPAAWPSEGELLKWPIVVGTPRREVPPRCDPVSQPKCPTP